MGFIYISQNECVWAFPKKNKLSLPSARNQFISINLSKHLYRLAQPIQIYVRFYFYNQFSGWEFVRSSSFLSLFFSFDQIKRICFMSILIELLGESEWEEVKNWLRLLLRFHPTHNAWIQFFSSIYLF